MNAMGQFLLWSFFLFTVFAIAPQYVQDQQEEVIEWLAGTEEGDYEDSDSSRTGNQTVEEEDEVSHPRFRLHELAILCEFMESHVIYPDEDLSHSLISPPPEA